MFHHRPYNFYIRQNMGYNFFIKQDEVGEAHCLNQVRLLARSAKTLTQLRVAQKAPTSIPGAQRQEQKQELYNFIIQSLLTLYSLYFLFKKVVKSKISNSIHPDPAPHAPTSLLPIFTAIFIFESYLCNESNISQSVSFIIFKCRCYRVLRSDQGGQ